MKKMCVLYQGRPQTFFQGRAKFSRGGQKHTICLKTPKKILFFSKKVQKHTILAGQGGARAPSCPPLRTPMGTFFIESSEKNKACLPNVPKLLVKVLVDNQKLICRTTSTKTKMDSVENVLKFVFNVLSFQARMNFNFRDRMKMKYDPTFFLSVPPTYTSYQTKF